MNIARSWVLTRPMPRRPRSAGSAATRQCAHDDEHRMYVPGQRHRGNHDASHRVSRL